MTDTGYSFSEVIWWLLVAALVGFVIGWILRRWFLNKEMEEQRSRILAEEEAKRSELTVELEDWKSKATSFSSDLDKANAQIAGHESQREELEAKAAEARTSAGKARDQVADRESTIASLRSDLEAASGKLAESQNTTADYEERIAALQADLENATGELSSTRQASSDKDETIASLQSDLTAARAEIGELTAKAGTGQDAEAELKSQITGLEARLSAADSSSAVADLEARLAAAEADRDRNAALLSQVEASHAQCAERSEADANRIAALEARLAETPPPAAEELPDKDVAVAKVAEIATRTRGTGPVVEDDLKKIHGVGPKLERLLKSMDITSFRQVANFTADDIQYVTAALDAFPGRIERDDWMSSAAEQHQSKYGEPA